MPLTWDIPREKTSILLTCPPEVLLVRLISKTRIPLSPYNTKSTSAYTDLEKAVFTHVVLPVPRGPNKKKLLPSGE